MKYLLTFLSLSLLFSQELEVEGNLKVTGTVESTTIDSLEQVIEDLQIQLQYINDNQGINRAPIFSLGQFSLGL